MLTLNSSTSSHDSYDVFVSMLCFLTTITYH